jgi:hypothetical protein
MRTRLVVVAVIVCAGCVGCGSGGHAKVTTQILGGQPRERALARAILERISPSPVTVVRFRGLQHDAVHHWPGRRMDVVGDSPTAAGAWQEEVFGYSYALLARAHHIPIGFVTTDGGGGLLDAELRGAPTKPIDESVLDAYEGRLRSAAKEAGVPIAFRVLRPGPVALIATVTAAKPALFLKRHSAAFWNLWRQGPRSLLGFLLTVEDAKGKPVIEEDWMPNEGGGFVRPDLSGCTHFWDHSAPARMTPPPCPA